MDDESAGHPEELSPLERVRRSARGWQKAQLAVLAAPALFGVLKSRTESPAPSGMQLASGVLSLVALGIACWAVFLVGRVAWPLPGGGVPAQAREEAGTELAPVSRRLRRGQILTYVAIGTAALATTSLWWPSPA